MPAHGENADPSPRRTISTHLAVEPDLGSTLRRFWDVEEVTSVTIFTPEEEACYSHFRSTYTRNAEGRFVVRLPFISPPEHLDMRGIAEANLKRLERKFDRQPEVAAAHKGFMEEYLRLNHMERVPDDEEKSPCTYIPHHLITKKDNPSKVRVVFNASQRNFKGICINSLLHTGPKLQEDVLAIILRWSFFPYVFSCDVVKMFRQFLIHRLDVDWQRIVWRWSNTELLQLLRLLTVTYGFGFAPFVSNACMLQLAADVEATRPRAAVVLRKRRYADDFYAGADSISEALEVHEELIASLASAKMEVGKWSANAHKLLPTLDSGETEPKDTLFQDEVVSALGLRWNAKDDSFGFKITQLKLGTHDPVTKRRITSDVTKLFDPIGWLSPVLIKANIWREGED